MSSTTTIQYNDILNYFAMQSSPPPPLLVGSKQVLASHWETVLSAQTSAVALISICFPCLFPLFASVVSHLHQLFLANKRGNSGWEWAKPLDSRYKLLLALFSWILNICFQNKDFLNLCLSNQHNLALSNGNCYFWTFQGVCPISGNSEFSRFTLIFLSSTGLPIVYLKVMGTIWFLVSTFLRIKIVHHFWYFGLGNGQNVDSF